MGASLRCPALARACAVAGADFLAAGDVIVQADGHEVRTTDDVVSAARDGNAVLLVRRGAVQEFVGLAVGH